MSSPNQKYSMITVDGAPVPEKELEELCRMHDIPMILGKMCFCLIKGQLYVKIPLLIEKGHQRGIQRVKIVRKEDPQTKTYESEVSIYPKVDKEVLKLILQFPKELHKEMWEFYSAPTVAIGRASPENVSNAQMHKFLPEMADKRGLGRGLRIFAGIGHTSYEEREDVVLTEEELADPQGLEIERTVTNTVDPSKIVEAETVHVNPVNTPKPEVPKKTEAESSTAHSKTSAAATVTPPTATMSAAASPSTPTNTETPTQNTSKCQCGHGWDRHFATRDRVGCTKCFSDKPKSFICNVTPQQLEEYKRGKVLQTAAVNK